MKSSTLLLIGGGILAALYISNLGIAGATAQFVFNGVTFNGLTNWTISIVAQNVSNANISLNSMAGTVEANGTAIGNFSFFPVKPLLIPANSQMNVPITFQPSLLSIPAEILSAVTHGTKDFNFDVSGNANVNGLVIPFDITSDINLNSLSA